MYNIYRMPGKASEDHTVQISGAVDEKQTAWTRLYSHILYNLTWSHIMHLKLEELMARALAKLTSDSLWTKNGNNWRDRMNQWEQDVWSALYKHTHICTIPACLPKNTKSYCLLTEYLVNVSEFSPLIISMLNAKCWHQKTWCRY